MTHNGVDCRPVRTGLRTVRRSWWNIVKCGIKQYNWMENKNSKNFDIFSNFTCKRYWRINDVTLWIRSKCQDFRHFSRTIFVQNRWIFPGMNSPWNADSLLGLSGPWNPNGHQRSKFGLWSCPSFECTDSLALIRVWDTVSLYMKMARVNLYIWNLESLYRVIPSIQLEDEYGV